MRKVSLSLVASFLVLNASLIHATPKEAIKPSPSESSMKEMSDESLANQEARSGITIDVSYELKIGEVVWHDSDGTQLKDNTGSTITPAPTRYIPPVVVNGEEL